MPLRKTEGSRQVQISRAHLLVRKSWWFGRLAFNLSDGNNAETVFNVRSMCEVLLHGQPACVSGFEAT